MTSRKLGLLLGVVLVIAVVIQLCGLRRPWHGNGPASGDQRRSAEGADDDHRRRSQPAADDENGPALVGIDARSQQRASPTATTWSEPIRTPAQARPARSPIETDITPLIVNVGGLTFSGNDVLAATLASPQFASNDYGSTPFATRRRTRTCRDRTGRPSLAERRRRPAPAPGRDDAGAVQQDGEQRLPPEPAPERPAGGDDQRSAEPGDSPPERPWRRLRRHQHQLVGGADPEPRDEVPTRRICRST